VNGREESGLGDADAGVGGHHQALGGGDVGPPLEQRGGQPGGDGRRLQVERGGGEGKV
jgi:hypothetical protein